MLTAEIKALENTDNMRILDFSPQVLKELRLEKRLKQSELADKLGITQGAVAKYEKDRIPNWDELKRIGEFFNVYFVADWNGVFSESEKPAD